MLNFKPKETTMPFQTISCATLARYAKNIADRTQFCKIAVIGSQGTGKTNCVVNIIKWLNVLCKDDVLVVYAKSNNIIPMLTNIEDTAKTLHPFSIGKKYLVFFLDDFSYVLETSPEIRNTVKHNYTKLRHVFRNKCLLSIMTIHYKKAVQPLLRDTYIRIYTHLNAEMLYDFKNNYKLYVYAKNFINYINKYYIENAKFVYECAPDETINVNNNKIESVSLNTKHKHNDSVIIEISRDDERLGIIDLGTNCKYVYYNILYNAKSEFELDNICVFSANNYNESFSIEADNVHIIDTNIFKDGKEENGSIDREEKKEIDYIPIVDIEEIDDRERYEDIYNYPKGNRRRRKIDMSTDMSYV